MEMEGFMHKEMKKFAQENGFLIETKKEIAYGQKNGFFFVIYQMPISIYSHRVQLFVKLKRGEREAFFSDFLNECKERYEYLLNAYFSGEKMIAQFQGKEGEWEENYSLSIDAFLEEITRYCKGKGFIQCCEGCGKEYGLSFCELEGEDSIICSDCFDKKLKEEKTWEKNGNFLGGVIGGFLGSFIGVAFWTLLGQLGYDSSIAGMVMIFFALKGYEKFSGKLDKGGIAACSLLCLLMIWVAEQTTWAFLFYNQWKIYNQITYFETFRNIPSLIKEEEFGEIRMALREDLIKGYMMMALGAFGTVRQAFRNSKKTGVKRITPVN